MSNNTVVAVHEHTEKLTIQDSASFIIALVIIAGT